MKTRVLYWFRTDLRLHGSPALKAALDLNPEVLYPVWTWDPHYVYHAKVGPNRWQFLLDCQTALSEGITRLNPKSRLLVVREGPTTILPKLFKAWKISHLVFEKDTDSYARKRDDAVLKLAKEAGVECIVRYGRTLWDSDDIVDTHGGPTMMITQLQKAGEKLGPPPRPIPAPMATPDPGELSLEGVEQSLPGSEYVDADQNQNNRASEDASYHSGLRGPNDDFSVPTMEELKMKATTPHRGGEDIALKMLENILSDKHYTATFAKPDTAPTAFDPASTCLLSPHMHFGSISCRKFYWGVQDIVEEWEKSGKKATHPPTSLTGQILFREMYFAAQAGIGECFGQTLHNPKVRYIPWHLPSILEPTSTDPPRSMSTKGLYKVDIKEAEEWFTRWREGQTGFPWIDAIMIQLRREGWVHHLARHAVACFLTRGGCYIDWERGAEVFEEWLLDHEISCNAGNWQWLSCAAFFSQYMRVYSPIAFPQKTDKEGKYVRHFIPQLKDFPEKYIYEPWKCPIADQRAAGCIIGKDYPKPMFDWKERREICLRGMKAAYEAGFYGSSEEVINGTANEVIKTRFGGDIGGSISSEGVQDKEGNDEVGDDDASGSVETQKRSTKSSVKRGQTTLDGVVTRKKPKI
ncbi:Cryptochrome-1 [Dactylella cylindrospora]|nr:Cryptochrome-1 [Dactylella cylindrospora]